MRRQTLESREPDDDLTRSDDADRRWREYLSQRVWNQLPQDRGGVFN